MSDDLDNLFDDDLYNLFDEPAGDGLSGLFDERPEQTGMDMAAGAAMDFAESMLGVGDEAGAIGLGLGGSIYDLFNTDKSLGEILDSNWSWEKNISEARATLDQFEEENPALSGAITAAGIGGSLLIPGAGAVKLAQTGGRAVRAAKTFGLVAAEGAAYGALSGREEEGRIQGALLGGAVGGTLGLGVSMLLRNSDEIAAMAKADEAIREAPEQGHIAGKGFVEDAADNRATRDVSKDSGVSSKKRDVKKVVTQEEYDAAADLQGIVETNKKTGWAGKWVNDLTSWVEKNVGERAARLTGDAEWMQRQARGEWVAKIEDKLKGFDEMVSGNPALSAALNNLGRKNAGKVGTWGDVYKAVGDDEAMRTQVQVFQNMYNDLKALDAPGRTTFDWIHTSKLAGSPTVKEGGLASEGHYMGPASAMIEYVDEVVAANALAERFGIKMSDLNVTKKSKGKERSAGIGKEKVNTKPLMEAVLEQIKKKAKAEGASTAVANNLDDALRTVFVSSKAGGDAAGAIARKVSSGAMLGSPMNAYLNISEWFTPAFQNGIVAWGKQVPKMVAYGLREVIDNWGQVGKYSLGPKGMPQYKGTVRFAPNQTEGITPQNMGLGDQFMGEVASEATSSFGKLMDRTVKFVYDKSFVTASNRIGQFAQMNSAVNRGRALANTALKGGEKGRKALEKLRRHDGMRGLSESEFDATLKALASGDVDNSWVRNFAGSSLNMWQPVSSTALPKGMADNPDARMFYSMLTYMNRQANGMREKIGKPMLEAYEAGLNTEKGRTAAKEAAMASARYVAYYGMFAGLWERHRSSLDPSRDIDTDELWTAEGLTEATIAQLVSNLSSGMVDTRAAEYGASPVDFTPAPIQWGGKVASGVASGMMGMLSGEDVLDPQEDNMKNFYRMLQGQVPLVAGVDKMHRVLNDGERLLVQPEDR